MLHIHWLVLWALISFAGILCFFFGACINIGSRQDRAEGEK